MKTSEIVAYTLMIVLAPLTALTLFVAFLITFPRECKKHSANSENRGANGGTGDGK